MYFQPQQMQPVIQTNCELVVFLRMNAHHNQKANDEIESLNSE